ncbi:MAG: Ti-type conjugative transfer relaxase TraA [Phenylobacterium sp.]|uniref:Ti-type conjugative transfer relaxase TraA n=1 Tax=Phenylobacterium sp. TaxID=1871053 RepID=UPI0011F467C3|nr:Ti-type conjugative transfer relaxase TraA [Phenylobacterium sp.]TAJ70418.1 MAG: Ti-type conjugative transfer relaxase TraA [Phenylobacterium sp.]
MAIYHFSAKVISRANGASAVAAAAYRAASRLEDERLGRAHDFTNKAGVVHSEILTPDGSPERWQDRATLWNEVEAGEKRKDAQLAREVEFAIPREMNQADGAKLAREFVQREFVDKGMVADFNVHWDVGDDGTPKPHAHVMLTMREAKTDGFGPKVRDWNDTELLNHWREAWSDHVNARLAELGIDARIDHRSFKDQGLDLEPQNKIGPAGARRDDRGETAERAEEHRQIARRNGERIIADPKLALSAITHQQSTFTDHDLARFVHRHTDDKAQFDRALAAVRAAPETIRLGRDGQGRERFTSLEMLAVERRLEDSAEALAAGGGHGLGAGARAHGLAASEARGIRLSEQQRDAFGAVTDERGLVAVIGYAGSGKSAMLGAAKDAWEAQGYRVRGAALSGMAAENLEGGSNIPSRTLASLEHAWSRGRDTLTNKDVLVVDEAGLVGSRQMERVLSQARDAGAKVVLVGDAEQLQAIEAGAAFRALTERHGAAEITAIRRQREDWQRTATRELATGRTGEALARYAGAGMVHAHDTQDAARAALVERWAAHRAAEPERSQVMLAYTRDDVAELNSLARASMREAGGLGEDQTIATARGSREMAAGDRLMFLRNERDLGVKNGTLGTLESASASALSVRLDGGRCVRVDLKSYNDLDHGYAATIHKSQGTTVDRAHVLASGHMDRHAAYVALSRHRERVDLHYSREAFAEPKGLARALSRERAKDTTLDYRETFAERRGLAAGDRTAVGLGQGRFGGFKPGRGEGLGQTPSAQTSLEPAVRQYAKAFLDAERMRAAGLPVLEHQQAALERAGRAVEAQRPGLREPLDRAMQRNPELGAGRPNKLLEAAERNAAEPRAGLERERTRGRGSDGPHGPSGSQRDRDWDRGR